LIQSFCYDYDSNKSPQSLNVVEIYKKTKQATILLNKVPFTRYEVEDVLACKSSYAAIILSLTEVKKVKAHQLHI
jgi:hypothetical protein